MAENEYNTKLEALGLSLKSELVEPGGYERAAKYRCTLERNGQVYSFDYTTGWGNRCWRSSIVPAFERTSYHAYFGKPQKRGERVQPAWGKRLKSTPELEAWFADRTAPIPPTLADAVYALASDAGCVRHGQSFAEFCSELCDGNTDSIKNKDCFDGCRESWAGLVRLGLDCDELDEIMEGF